MHPERVKQKGNIMSIYPEKLIHFVFHPFRVTNSVRSYFLLSYSQLRRDFSKVYILLCSHLQHENMQLMGQV
jgi:hypothetical protein